MKTHIVAQNALAARASNTINLNGTSIDLSHNLLISGASAAGKSVAVRTIATQVAEAGEPLVFFDPCGEYTRAFYRDGRDIILNPFDARCPGYDPFNDIRDSRDVDAFVDAWFPAGAHPDNTAAYFKSACKEVLKAICQKLIERNEGTLPNLITQLADSTPENMPDLLCGTNAEPFVNPSNRGAVADMVLTQLHHYIISLRYLRPGQLSLRDVIAAGGDVRIFISGHYDLHGVLAPLYRALLSTCCDAVTADQVQRPVTFLLDEYGMLNGPIERMVEALSHPNARTVIAVQHIHQLVRAYGKAQLDAVLQPVQNHLQLRSPEVDRPDLRELADNTGYLTMPGGTSLVMYEVPELAEIADTLVPISA